MSARLIHTKLKRLIKIKLKMKKIVKTIKTIILPNPEDRPGDIIAEIAQPIAGKIDRVMGTNLKKCGACDSARRELNEEAEKGIKII